MPAPNTYSFKDVNVAIVGPGVSFSLGSDAGASDEGISFSQVNEVGTMTQGAGGEVMHNLFASKAGKATVRLLKTSPVNAQLMAALAAQRASAANYGQNTLTMTNTVSGDVITCQQVGFAKVPDLNYAKEGGSVEWEFNVGIMDPALGAGVQG
jgi:hypothetical protein